MSTPVFRRDRPNMTHRSLEETLARRAIQRYANKH
jgi:hypothetical protein